MTTVQARNGGIRVARKVTQSDIAKWKELRSEGHTYAKIGELVGWNAETIRKYIGGGGGKAMKEDLVFTGSERVCLAHAVWMAKEKAREQNQRENLKIMESLQKKLREIDLLPEGAEKV